MKAAIYRGQYQLEMTSLPTPHPGPNDVVIQNLYAGICGSDVAVYNHGADTGHKIAVGGEFGHEAVSRIAEIGANITEFQVGERVYPFPLYATGDPHRAGTMGAFSEYILVPNAKLNHSLYRIPDSIPNKISAMIEPFTVATNAARHGHLMPGENAIVYGAGTIGIATGVALKQFGAKSVIMVDQSDYRLTLAAKLGLKTINNRREDVKTRSIELLGKAFGIHGDCPEAAVYIDAIGRNAIMHDFIDFGKIDSRFVGVGINTEQPDFKFTDLIFGSQSIGGAGGYRPIDVTTVLDTMTTYPYDLSQMVTQTVSWEHLEEGIQTATDVNRALKVLVDYQV
ncbi:threonine dehydrogenase [Lactiplantibacillus fabifermentans T30PCM01]|uniref:Threonine dehydrogenase n=1 Tax=Lactiplantibacillus fabifermentans T30PCM01 TaxID=1400520 RepID=W6T4G3_9LACO|nr:zinc-binding dehydrogenase [Lactiplantibacillus fabifermentans]ETY72588.1 threonine dehydrogenase [Lactiplantibacillus fabifermentans T30PCM01]